MRALGPAAAALLLCALAAAPARAAQPPVTLDDIACAAFGHKRPGTAADRGMGDLIRSRFQRAGLDTRVEAFDLPRFDISATRIAELAPARREIPGTAFAYSGVGTAEGAVVYVGTGRDGDYAG